MIKTYIYGAAGLAAGALLVATYMQGRKDGAARVQAKWDAAVLAAEQQSDTIKEAAHASQEKIEDFANEGGAAIGRTDIALVAELSATQRENNNLRRRLDAALNENPGSCIAEPVPADLSLQLNTIIKRLNNGGSPDTGHGASNPGELTGIAANANR